MQVDLPLGKPSLALSLQGEFPAIKPGRLLPVEGGKKMAEVHVRKNESLDKALRRLKKSIAKDGTMRELKKRKFYEKPSVKRKKKADAARKRK